MPELCIQAKADDKSLKIEHTCSSVKSQLFFFLNYIISSIVPSKYSKTITNDLLFSFRSFEFIIYASLNYNMLG